MEIKEKVSGGKGRGLGGLKRIMKQKNDAIIILYNIII